MRYKNRFLLPATFAAGAALAAITAIAATPAAAPAEGPQGTPPEHHSRTIDVAKMQERAQRAFARADANGDATISRDEFANVTAPRMMKGKHSGGHHRMSGAAVTNADLFAALDTDGSGQVSATEFEQLRAKTRELRRNAAFDRMDANADGVLDADEFPPFARRAAELDTDGDGTVTREEMRAGRAAMKPASPDAPKAP